MDKTVATTILAQLGGNRFLAMTGARDLLDCGDGLSMRLPRGTKNKATHLRITLAADDTYTLRFLAIRGVNVRDVSETTGVYADQLQNVFTAETGFDTSLGTMKGAA